MKKPALPKPPAHLSVEARKLWSALVLEYVIDDAGSLALLLAVCESRDRAESCRRAIATEGQTIVDRFGQRKPHPLLPVERDARSAMVTALKALRLPMAAEDETP